MINGEKEPFRADSVFDDVTFERIINNSLEIEPIILNNFIIIFKKMVLIGLLYKYFIDNLYYFPSHLIRVYKQDVLNIESIAFAYEYSGANLTSPSTIDLCKLGNLCKFNLIVALIIDGNI